MTTIAEQAEVFMTNLSTRSRRPLHQGTLCTYQSHVNKWIAPHFSNHELSEVRNRVAKEFIYRLRISGLKNASIKSIFNVLKMVIASAVNEEGDQLYPVKWNLEFIDLPLLVKSEQQTPSVWSTTITKTISRALGPDKALYAICAGAGLRIGEALSLRFGKHEDDGIGSFWLPAEKKLIIRGTVSRGRIQDAPKTPAGVREVDLCSNLNDYLRETLVTFGSKGLLFPSEVGGVACQRTVYNHLRDAGMQTTHPFRRFRVSTLRKNRVPEDLVKYWTGHAKQTVTDGYSKLAEDLELRRDWVEKVGLGFEL